MTKIIAFLLFCKSVCKNTNIKTDTVETRLKTPRFEKTRYTPDDVYGFKRKIFKQMRKQLCV